MNITIKTSSSSKGGKGCGLAILGFFFLAALAATVGIFWTAIKNAETLKWTETPCTIERSELKENREDYAVVVQYSYRVDGRKFTSEVFSLSGQRKGEVVFAYADEAQAAVKKFKTGSASVCFVDPADPARAVLERSSMWNALWALIPITIAFLLALALRAVWRSNPGGVDASFARPVSDRVASGTASAKWGLRIFGLIFALVGFAVLWFMFGRPYQRLVSARSWQETPCVISMSDIRESRDSDGDRTYSLKVRYRYAFAGESFIGDRLGFVGVSTSSRSSMVSSQKRFPTGMKTVCYVNPAAPWESMLTREMGAFGWFALIPGVFILVGLGLFFSAGKATNPNPLRSSAPPSIVPTVRGGGYELKPQISSSAKFGCALTFAIIWNAIVWIVIISNDLSGGALIFAGIFALIGVAIAAGAVYCLLALFNPRPVIVLSQDTIRLGDTFELRYRFEGRVSRISHLFISLEGQEEATYRRGTDTITDKSCFAEIVLVKTRDRAAIASGELRVTIPADTMHTFEASNNKVLWRLHLCGDVANWPDVSFEAFVPVLPQLFSAPPSQSV